jgi:hypothetical protein
MDVISRASWLLIVAVVLGAGAAVFSATLIAAAKCFFAAGLRIARAQLS